MDLLTLFSKLEKVRHIEVRRHVDYQKYIIDYVHSKLLIWYGHVQRIEEDMFHKDIDIGLDTTGKTTSKTDKKEERNS